MDNRPVGVGPADTQMDMAELTDALAIFANTPNNEFVLQKTRY
jgi:hypothetical protein